LAQAISESVSSDSNGLRRHSRVARAFQPIPPLSRRPLLAVLAAIERFQRLGRRKLSQTQIRSLPLCPLDFMLPIGSRHGIATVKRREAIGRLGATGELTVEQNTNIVKTMFQDNV
jgi:hypothetical protein